MDRKQELMRRLQQISSEQLGVPCTDITEQSTWAQLGADSLDRLQMSRVIEDTFDVEIPHSMGERLNSVGETLDHVATLMATRLRIPGICVEGVSTDQQWDEVLGIRTQVFTAEYRCS